MTDYSNACRCYEYGDLGECVDCHCRPPIPHAHLASDSCVIVADACTGICNYECDVGYVWNPVTLSCDLIVKKAIMDGFMYIEE